ncbi:MAG: hypothetical protein KGH71_05575 [Candidatus Micrarchaeota archaeon]|nr:hypothetical protein [Candidatus Micrarchaeota archaeon]
MAKKSSSQKKIEMLRKTQELSEIVERGTMEEQALSDGADSQGVADDQHMTDLLTSEQEQWQKPSGSAKKPKGKSAYKQAKAKSAKKQKSAKKKSRR